MFEINARSNTRVRKLLKLDNYGLLFELESTIRIIVIRTRLKRVVHEILAVAINGPLQVACDIFRFFFWGCALTLNYNRYYHATNFPSSIIHIIIIIPTEKTFKRNENSLGGQITVGLRRSLYSIYNRYCANARMTMMIRYEAANSESGYFFF